MIHKYIPVFILYFSSQSSYELIILYLLSHSNYGIKILYYYYFYKSLLKWFVLRTKILKISFRGLKEVYMHVLREKRNFLGVSSHIYYLKM